jgi:hypothetical protein
MDNEMDFAYGPKPIILFGEFILEECRRMMRCQVGA